MMKSQSAYFVKHVVDTPRSACMNRLTFMRSEVKQPTYLFGTVAADHAVAITDSGDARFEVELTGLG